MTAADLLAVKQLTVNDCTLFDGVGPGSLLINDACRGSLGSHMDKISPKRRSANMAAIRSKDTTPELAVRRALHAAGLRYRMHGKELPGRPDIVFRRRRVCVFVHGCFWHGCQRCMDGRRAVKSNAGYWSAKVAGNKERDGRHQVALEAAVWTVLTVWECMAFDPTELRQLAETIRSISRRRH